MNILDEYRRNARECQRMAENAGNATDKASWLRLAASWLGMIKNSPADTSSQDQQAEQKGADRMNDGWPQPADEDSKASH